MSCYRCGTDGCFGGCRDCGGSSTSESPTRLLVTYAGSSRQMSYLRFESSLSGRADERSVMDAVARLGRGEIATIGGFEIERLS